MQQTVSRCFLNVSLLFFESGYNPFSMKLWYGGHRVRQPGL